MRGSVKGQVKFLMSFVVSIGESKHQAKIEARNNGYSDWHSIGKQLDIYSYATMNRYFDVWVELGKFMKESGIKSFDKITPEIVRSFLESKINDGLSKKTLMTTVSALEKLETALNRYAKEYNVPAKYDFQKALESVRKEIRQMNYEVKPRAYDSPQKVIENIRNKDFKVVAEVQYKAGARIHEIAVVKPEQLRGYKKDIDGKEKGIISIEGKGGKYRELLVPKEVYEYIREKVERSGEWRIDKADYRRELKEACDRAGEQYKGSHGLRWNYAEERLKAQAEYTGDFNVALGEVSKDMGHDRADITLHYLKR